MRVAIDRDEWWPFYEPVEEDRGFYAVVDVSAETLERWNAGLAAFRALQTEIAEAVSEARK